MSIRPGTTVTKRVGASLIYAFNWSEWLVSPATLASATFTITGPDAALTKDSPVTASPTSSVRLIGGTAGRTYVLTCTAVTNESPTQTDPQSIYVKIIP